MIKLHALFRRFLEWLLYFGEDPTDSMAYLNRRWRYWPAISWWKGRISIGYDLQLAQMEGRPHKPYTISNNSIEVIVDPRKWKIGYDHGYYDGPHHRAQFGPFAYFTNEAWDCKGCCGDG